MRRVRHASELLIMPTLCLLVAAGSAGAAPPVFKPVATGGGEENSLREQIGLLETQVKALQARVGLDEQKIQAAADAAGQAKAGVGLVNVGLGKQVAALQGSEGVINQRILTVEAKTNALGAQLGAAASQQAKLEALSQRFASHTHEYRLTHVIYDANDRTVKSVSYDKTHTLPPGS